MKAIGELSLWPGSSADFRGLATTRDRVYISLDRPRTRVRINVGPWSYGQRKGGGYTDQRGVDPVVNWQIGHLIGAEVLGDVRADYGRQIVATLSRQLSWSHFKVL